MKRLFFILAATLTAVTAHAATVAWSAAIDTGLIDSTGAVVAQGNFVRIGYFGTFSNAQVSVNALTSAGISLLNADFHQFASGTVGTGTGIAASFSFNSTPAYASLPGFAPNSQIYFWALKSTNNTTLANAVSTVTQTAIAEVPFAANPQWQFPASDLPPNRTIDLQDLSNASRQIQAGTYVAGNSASLTAIGFPATNHALQLATVVPEPSVLAFSALAALALAGARRRRQE